MNIHTYIHTYTHTHPLAPLSPHKPGYGVLFKSWESFYTRRLYHRIQDCWNRPINSNPGAYIDVITRESNDNNCTLKVTDQTTHCLNLGSYNYLGFADDWANTCRERVMSSLKTWPISMQTSLGEGGCTAIHKDLEATVARFVGKEAALVYTMGYGTNATTIPTLCGAGDLIISDSLNHTSIVNGARASGAAIRVFKHNDAKSLEEVRKNITSGKQLFMSPCHLATIYSGLLQLPAPLVSSPLPTYMHTYIHTYIRRLTYLSSLGTPLARTLALTCPFDPDPPALPSLIIRCFARASPTVFPDAIGRGRRS
jgi:hypothetical protein